MSFDSSVNSLTSVFTQEEPGCQRSVSGQHAFAFTAVACPGAKNEFCRFRFAPFVNTQFPLSSTGQESFLAGGHEQRLRPELSTSQGSSTRPGLPAPKGSRSSIWLLLFDYWEESEIKRDFLGYFSRHFFFLVAVWMINVNRKILLTHLNHVRQHPLLICIMKYTLNIAT